MGENGEITISVTEMPNGELHFNLAPSEGTDPEDTPDIDGIFFNVAEGSSVSTLNFFPDPNTDGRDVTDIQAEDDGVTGLPDGTAAGGTFDVGLQFGTVPDSSEGDVESTDFTLWTWPDQLSFEDIDLGSMRLIVDSNDGSGGEILEVTGSDDPTWVDPDAADVPDSATALMDALSLTSVPAPEDDNLDMAEDDCFDMA